MSKIAFEAEYLERYHQLVAKYERPQCALLPTLYLAQEQFEYLSNEVLEYVATLVDLPPARVFEAASFYTLFRREKGGRWCVQVCHNITCRMMGCELLLQIAQEELGIGVGETTEDGKIALQEVECLGACDKAPVAQVNLEYKENLNAETFRAMLRDLKARAKEETVERVL